MVTKKIDTRSLSLELSFPALQLDVRVNVELRTHDGRVFGDGDFDRNVLAAISETLVLHSDLYRFEAIRDLPKSVKAREKIFDELNNRFNGVTFSDRWVAHHPDQLDLFKTAGTHGTNLISGGLLVSPTEAS
jgi:hypothetical protein